MKIYVLPRSYGQVYEKEKKKNITCKNEKKKMKKENEITLWNDYVKTIDIQNDFCVF